MSVQRGGHLNDKINYNLHVEWPNDNRRINTEKKKITWLQHLNIQLPLDQAN